MRNLKKFLALVLAMMMAMSLMVTVNAASGGNFSDADDVNSDYAEAIEVLNALGVLTGYESGEFLPANPIRRGEFATILYRIHSGRPGMADMDAWASFADDFTDVGTKHWSAGAVGYVSYFDLMIGKDVGIFAPDTFISGDEVLVSLLRTMGLEEKDEFSGDGWNRRARGVAQSIGLLGTVTLPVLATEDYATREQVAQLAYEALIYTKTGPEIHYTIGGEEHYNTVEDAYDQLLDNGVDPGSSVIQQHVRYPGSLAARSFKGLHKSINGSRDDFQRPTISWNYENEVKVFESLKEWYAYYPSGTFTGAEAKALLKNLKNGVDDITLYYNGTKPDETNPDALQFAADVDVSTGLWYNDTTGIKGYEVWVYTSVSGYDVIVREAYAAKVTAATKAGNPIYVDIYEMGQAATGGGDPSWTTDKVTFTVKPSDDEDLYNTLAAFEDGAYIGVYAKTGFEAYVDGTDNPADFLLEIAPLTKVPDVVINHIQDKTYKTLSTILVDNSAASYGVNNEAMWTDGEDAWYGNVVRGDTGFTRATQLGNANLYLLNGYVLVVEQTEATRPGVHYAYLLDYQAVNGANAPDAWTPDWASATDVVLQLKIMLDDGTVIGADGSLYYMDWGTDECDTLWTARENGTGDNHDKATYGEGAKKAHLFETKDAAEEVGDALLNRLFVYDTRYDNLLTMVDYNYDTTGWDFDTPANNPGNYLYNPGYGEGVTGYSSATDPTDGSATGKAPNTGNELNVLVNPGVAKGYLDSGTESVIFDTETIFFVTNNLSGKNDPNADVKIYHGILDPELKKLEGAATTFVQYVLDEKTKDDNGNGGRVIAVLISMPKTAGGGTVTTPDTYFIVGYDTATLHKRYTEAYHGEDTPYIEYYEFWAIKNGTEKVPFDADENFPRDIRWGAGFTATNDIFTNNGSNLITDATTIEDDTTVAIGIKWTVLHDVINVTTKDKDGNGDPVVTGYVITKDTVVWLYDEETGDIDRIDPFKITENMVGYVHTDADGRLIALYLTIPTVS